VENRVELVPIQPDNRSEVENLFSFYLYDMSRYTHWPVGPAGNFEFDKTLLDPYWRKKDHYPFFIEVDSELAGFSLIRNYPQDQSLCDMGQFFVLGKFKGRGIGKEAFRQSVVKFPGPWLTRVLPENSGARNFWLKVISEFTHGEFEVTRDSYHGTMMDFIRYRI